MVVQYLNIERWYDGLREQIECHKLVNTVKADLAK